MGVGKCGSCAGKDHVLTRGGLSGFASTQSGSALCSNAWGDWAEVSRWHSSGCILMKRMPEAKRGRRSLCSALSFDRQVNPRCRRRDDGAVFSTINQLGWLSIGWSDYGSTFLVTARCGPACRVVWEGGAKSPFLSFLADFIPSFNPIFRIEFSICLLKNYYFHCAKRFSIWLRALS